MKSAKFLTALVAAAFSTACVSAQPLVGTELSFQIVRSFEVGTTDKAAVKTRLGNPGSISSTALGEEWTFFTQDEARVTKLRVSFDESQRISVMTWFPSPGEPEIELAKLKRSLGLTDYEVEKGKDSPDFISTEQTYLSKSAGVSIFARGSGPWVEAISWSVPSVRGLSGR